MKKIIAIIGIVLLGLCSQPVQAVTFKGGPNEEVVQDFLGSINNAPEISIAESTVHVDEGGYITVLIRVTDPDGDDVSLSATSATLPIGLIESANGVYQFHWASGYDQSGTHILNLRAEDVKNASASATLTVVVGDVSQGIQITGYSPNTPAPVSVNEGDSEIFFVQATSLDGKTLVYSWSINGTVVSTELFLGINFDFNDAGNYIVKVEVADGSDTVSQEWTVAVADVNRPPAIEVISITGGLVGELLTIGISGSDSDGDQLTFSHDGPGVLAGTTWSYTPVDTGEVTVSFTVTDGKGGVDSTTVTVTVAATDTGVADTTSWYINVVKHGNGTADVIVSVPAGTTFDPRVVGDLIGGGLWSYASGLVPDSVVGNQAHFLNVPLVQLVDFGIYVNTTSVFPYSEVEADWPVELVTTDGYTYHLRLK